MTHTVLLYVMDIHVFQYMYVCMAGKWVFNDFLLEQDGRNRTGDYSLYAEFPDNTVPRFDSQFRNIQNQREFLLHSDSQTPRRTHKNANITTGMNSNPREKPAARGGPRGCSPD